MLESPTFQLQIGPNKKSFNLHKSVLTQSCPYFATMLNTRIAMKEIAENSVTLDSPIDSENAWSMCFEYMYLGDYSTSAMIRSAAICFTHAGVYVLAQKLCMDGLKRSALGKMKKELERNLSPMCGDELERLVEIVYGNTPDEDDYEESPKKVSENDDKDAAARAYHEKLGIGIFYILFKLIFSVTG